MGDEKREDGCHDGKSRDQNKIGRHGREVRAGADMLQDGRKEVFFLWATLVFRQGLGKHEKDEGGIREGEGTGEVKRGGFTQPRGCRTAERGTENKTEAKCRADEAHRLRAVFGGGDIGDIGLRSADAAA